MLLKIKYIRDAGNLAQERLVLQTILDCEIGDYMTSVSMETGSGQSISPKIKSTYWFPDGKLAADSLVVLYTKKGINSVKINDDGSKSYFYYRNEAEPLFADPRSCAVVFEIKKWIYNAEKQ